MRRPGGDENVFSSERRRVLTETRGGALRFAERRCEHGANRRQDRFGFGQTAGTVFTAGHVAFIGLHDGDAVGAELRDIALRRGVQPHADIHRGRGEHRLVGR